MITRMPPYNVFEELPKIANQVREISEDLGAELDFAVAAMQTTFDLAIQKASTARTGRILGGNTMEHETILNSATSEIPTASIRAEYSARWPSSVPSEDQIDNLLHVIEVLTPPNQAKVEYWGDPSGNIRRMSGDQEIIATVTAECSEAEWKALSNLQPLPAAPGSVPPHDPEKDFRDKFIGNWEGVPQAEPPKEEKP